MQEQVAKLQKDQVESQQRRQEMLSELRSLVQSEVPIIVGRESIVEQRVAPAPLDPTDALKPSHLTLHATTTTTKADILFRNALVLYNAGNFAMAAESFTLALQSASDSDMKAKCLFWLGESNYRMKEWVKAVQCFSEILAEFPTHPILPAAMLKKGFAFLFAGEQASGIQTLQSLVQVFPQSDEAAIAREQLQRMRSVIQ